MCLSASVGLSRLFENEDPVLAGRLFPLNTEAVVRETADALTNRAPDDAALAALKTEIEDAIRYDRIDSRLYSLLGEIVSRIVDRQAAGSYFDQSSKLSRTDMLALHYLIRRSIDENDRQAAVSNLDIMLRRWPGQLEQLAPALLALLAEPEGYAAIVARLGANPPWRTAFIAQVANDPAMASKVEPLLLDLRTKSSLTGAEITAVVTGLMTQRRYAQAYSFFFFTLTEEEQSLGGYIFNSRFAPVSTNRPFDWQLGRHPGVDISGPMVPQSRSEAGVVLRFLGTPVKSIGLHQILQMPPGNYSLLLEASAQQLQLPKGLFWSLRCVDGGEQLARLDIADGSYERRIFRVEATVPTACSTQILSLDTDLIAESWRHRYSGQISMFELKAERAQRL